jgi:ABC-type transport system substrate-binding protein
MAFNLRNIKTASSFDLAIKDQDGNPTGVVFTLAGPTHPVRKAMDMAKSRKLIQQANKTGRVTLPDPADAEASKPKDLAQLTLGWSGYVDEAGQPVAYSIEAAEALYADPDMSWLVDQVDEGLGNKALFIRAASAN